MTSLNGATVLITGANGGLGTALVHGAIDRGAVRVYAGARNPKDWGNDRIVPLTLDLTDPTSIEKAAETAGDTTVLINNAAIFARSELLTGPIEDLTTTSRPTLSAPCASPALLRPHWPLARARWSTSTRCSVGSPSARPTASPRPACGWPPTHCA